MINNFIFNKAANIGNPKEDLEYLNFLKEHN